MNAVTIRVNEILVLQLALTIQLIARLKVNAANLIIKHISKVILYTTKQSVITMMINETLVANTTLFVWIQIIKFSV